jgi:hypothetical protein
MDLATMRAQVRRDLKDTDASAYRWTDAELDGHIARALAEYGESCPLAATATKTAGALPDYDLSAEGGYLWCIEAEWPIGKSPTSRVPIWERTRGSVRLQLAEGSLPMQGESVRFYYAKAHTLGATSTVPPEHEPVVQLGAVAYALAAMAAYSVDRIATTGRGAEEWFRLSAAALESFRRELNRIGRRASGGFAGWGEVAESWRTV